VGLGLQSFGPVAPFYDELMDTVPYRMWVSYLLLLLSQQDVHPKKFLDVCCGTGTMCELLENEGFEVQGFDISAPMIESAREKAKHHLRSIRYEVMDAAEFEMGETYDAAFSFFDSLNYITDVDRLASAIKQVGKHVVRGGSFIFDLNTAYAFEAKLFDQRARGPKARVKYDWVGDYNPETRIIHVDMKFWWHERQYHETHVQRAHTDEEIRAMLNEAGFSQIRCYESYSLDPPRAKTDRVHYSAIRT
jgi:ubiquinone/menaquinone biosynthesis C-methylase UbiE